MKITLDLPYPTLREAKLKAAREGISISRFVTGAISEKLATANASKSKPWMKHVGKLKHLHKESRRIEKLIHERFGRIETAP